MNKTQTGYLVAAGLLAITVYILWKSQETQLQLINSMASPFNVEYQKESDEKLVKKDGTSKEGFFSKLLPITNEQVKKTKAEAVNQSKFPSEPGTPSQHEEYTEPIAREVVREEIQTMDTREIGDRTTIRVPGERSDL